jgi:hypothetical protein
LAKADRQQMHPGDADARMLKGRTAKNLELATTRRRSATPAKGSSLPQRSAQLGPMLEQVIENTGRAADETLADSGYDRPSRWPKPRSSALPC